MSTIMTIRHHINRLAPGELFTTRDLLRYGTRTAVDQATHKLNKQAYVERLARGVFRKPPHDLKKVSPLEVALAKAKAFGRIILEDANVADDFGIAGNIDGNNCICFITTGSTSTFKVGGITVYSRHASPRKIQLGNSRAARVVRAIWRLTKRRTDQQVVTNACTPLNRVEKDEIMNMASWLPEWLRRYFYARLRIVPRPTKEQRLR